MENVSEEERGLKKPRAIPLKSSLDIPDIRNEDADNVVWSQEENLKQKKQLLITMCERENIPMEKMNWSDIAQSLQCNTKCVHSLREVQNFWFETLEPFLAIKGTPFGVWRECEIQALVVGIFRVWNHEGDWQDLIAGLTSAECRKSKMQITWQLRRMETSSFVNWSNDMDLLLLMALTLMTNDKPNCGWTAYDCDAIARAVGGDAVTAQDCALRWYASGRTAMLQLVKDIKRSTWTESVNLARSLYDKCGDDLSKLRGLESIRGWESVGNRVQSIHTLYGIYLTCVRNHILEDFTPQKDAEILFNASDTSQEGGSARDMGRLIHLRAAPRVIVSGSKAAYLTERHVFIRNYLGQPILWDFCAQCVAEYIGERLRPEHCYNYIVSDRDMLPKQWSDNDTYQLCHNALGSGKEVLANKTAAAILTPRKTLEVLTSVHLFQGQVWNSREIIRMIRLVCVYHACQLDTKWSIISDFIGRNRSSDECRAKYNEIAGQFMHLFRPWSQSEDYALMSSKSEQVDRLAIQCRLRAMYLRSGTWSVEEEATLWRCICLLGLQGKSGKEIWDKVSARVGCGKSALQCYERYSLYCAQYPTIKLGPLSDLEERIILFQIYKHKNIEEIDLANLTIQQLGRKRLRMQCEYAIEFAVKRSRNSDIVPINAEKESRLVNFVLPLVLRGEERSICWEDVSLHCGNTHCPEAYRRLWEHTIKPGITFRRNLTGMWTQQLDNRLVDACLSIGRQRLESVECSVAAWKEVAEIVGCNMSARGCLSRFKELRKYETDSKSHIDQQPKILLHWSDTYDFAGVAMMLH